MKRTITMSNGYAYCGNKPVGYIVSNIRFYFNLKYNHKYTITIVEGTQFSFHREGESYCLRKRNMHVVGFICAEPFDEFFFKPSGRKKYDITVIKLRK